MSTLFNLSVPKKVKPKPSVHPWEKTIKPDLSHEIKQSHNSVKNVRYPKSKEKVPPKNRITFSVWGNRVTREFIHCVNLVQGMHKYRWKKYAPPVIRAFTGVEWEPSGLKELKLKYGDIAYCLEGQVAVIMNDVFLGGEKELKDLIETKYYIHMLALDYQKESVKLIKNFIKTLYSEIVPRTCENFLHLCQTRKGGYSGTPVHRIVKDGWIQCGGFGLKNVDNISCENFIVPHDRRGVLAMANAGRDTDCSTQFFVLLQPSPCFNLRFVAFGQLIDGEETLKKIEAVETYYEAPLDTIIIYRAGIMNVDCKDIRINKGAREYIDKHIEDLNIIGDMFYAMLLEKVFIEIELRRLQRLQPPETEELIEEAFKETVDAEGNYIPAHINATRRYIRKKEQLQENQNQSSLNAKRTEDDAVNNEFDVDSFSSSYVMEEKYTYSKVSVASSVTPKPARPYYLALTDVPYPGEVDSTFDLKRFLQGHYCLETDLTPEDEEGNPQQLTCRCQRTSFEEKMRALSEIVTSYRSVKLLIDDSDSEDSSVSEKDSDVERECREYIEQNVEKVSFSGKIIKHISLSYITPLEEKTPRELWNDEEIRRMRMAMQDVKNRERKKVSISAEPWLYQKQIKRRMTGIVKSDELPEMFRDKEEEEDEEAEDFEKKKGPSVTISAPDHAAHKIKRRQTGFSPEVFAKDFTEHDDEVAEEEKRHWSTIRSKVQIAPQAMNERRSFKQESSRLSITRRATNVETTRPSVLVRLYDDIAIDDDEVPTLKDYTPMAEKKSKLDVFERDDKPFLLRRSVKYNELSRELSSTPVRSMFRKKVSNASNAERADIDQKINMQDVHVPHAPRRDMSPNALEYIRRRPFLSVSEYQEMNRAKMEKVERETKKKNNQ